MPDHGSRPRARTSAPRSLVDEAPSSAPPVPASPRARVLIEPSGGQRVEPVEVDAEVALTPSERARGLMFRCRLADDAGMLFVFDASDRHTFWMANTPLSLDMIFIGADGRVVGVVEDAEPMSPHSYGVDAPSMYVLEVNAGFAARHGVGPDARARIVVAESTSPER